VRGQYGTPKSLRSSRAVPLVPQLESELEAHLCRTLWNRDDDLVFAHPHTGRPLDRVRLGYHFKAALKRAGVREVRFHDLRHTFATTVAASGEFSIRTLQEWMGHCDLRTTQIYADYMPGEREAQMLGAVFGSGPHVVRNSRDTAQSDTPQTPVNTA
jgi:integrase